MVEVPCAVDVVDVARLQPRLAQRHPHSELCALAFRMRRGDVVGIARKAVAHDLCVDPRAARLGVLVFLEHPPCPRPRPSRNRRVPCRRGGLPFRGASLLSVLSARAWAKPATPSGLIVPSAPPATIMSASSSLIIRAASPIACAPDEQAVTTAWLGPISPYLIDTWPEIRLISRPCTKCGETRPGPRSCRLTDSSSIPGNPPMPEPIEQPVRIRVSSSISARPASSSAWPAASMP